MAHSRRAKLDVVIGVIILFACSLGHQAWAKPEDNPYEAARDAEARLDYKSALKYSKLALERANTHDQLVTIYRILGTSNALLGKTEDAVDAFTRLLAIDPDHRLPKGTSPKINTPFKEAGGYWVDRPGGIQLVPSVPKEVAAAKDLMIPVKLEDPLGMVTNLRLSYRTEAGADWRKLEATVTPMIAFTIPASEIPAHPNDYSIEMYVAALGSTGSEVRLAGDANKPMSIVVRVPKESGAVVTISAPGGGVQTVEKKPNPILRKWWLWTAVGGVVVLGAALGGGLGWYYSRDTSHVDATVTTRALTIPLY
jgi:hypothetical protein